MTPNELLAAAVQAEITHDADADTLRLLWYIRIGKAAHEAEMAFEGYWWCGCGDGVDPDDPWWRLFGRCVNCCAGAGIEWPKDGCRDCGRSPYINRHTETVCMLPDGGFKHYVCDNRWDKVTP